MLSPSAPAPAVSTVPDWAFQFAAAEAESKTSVVPEQDNTRTLESSDLPTTAALLINSVQKDIEANPKFQNSEFMSLMRRIRDREVVVQGNEMVNADGSATISMPAFATTTDWAKDFATTSSTATDKGKGRAVEEDPVFAGPSVAPLRNNVTYNISPRLFVSLQRDHHSTAPAD